MNVRWAILAVACALFLPGALHSQKDKKQPPKLPPKPKVIYVSDFELDSIATSPEPHPTSAGATNPGVSPVSRIVRSDDNPTDAAARAQRIVGIISAALVDDLVKAGFSARHLFPSEALPAEGLQIRGVFAEADPGNRLRRAVVGANTQGAEWLLLVAFTDLSKPEQPLYRIAKDDGNYPAPGALIALNPLVPVLKFEVEKNITDKLARKAASAVCKEIDTRYNPPKD